MFLTQLKLPALFALFSSLAAGSIFATDYTFTGKAPSPNNQLWSQPQNWSPNTGVPGPGDTATIGTNTSGFAVNVDSAVTVDAVTGISSILQGAGSLTVNFSMACENMILTVGGGINVKDSFAVNPVPGIPVYNTTTVNCPMTIMDGSISSNAVFQFGAAVRVDSQGVFLAEGGSQLEFLNIVGALFVNHGTFSVPNGLAIISGGSSVFSNAPSGTVVAHTGATLEIQGTLAQNGNFAPDINGVIIVTAATAIHDGATFGGSGLTRVDTGQHTLAGTATISGNLQWGTNGTPGLTMNGTLEVAEGGSFAVLGGTLAGVGTNVTGTLLIDTSGVMQMNNLNGLTFKNIIITNNGSINWLDSGNTFLGFNAQIINAGSFNAFGDGALDPINGGPPAGVASFDNSDGMFIKQQGSLSNNATTTISIPFTNGQVIDKQGAMAFTGGGSIGTWQVDANASVTLKGGTYTLNSTEGFGGAAYIEGFGGGVGPVTMNSGVVLNFPTLGTLDILGGEFVQTGGTMNGAGDSQIVAENGGLFLWDGGTIDSSGIRILSSGFMQISSNNGKSAIQDFFENQGTVTWINANNNGAVDAGDGVVFDNAGRFNIECDSGFSDVATNTHPVFTNEVTGVITKAFTTGVTDLGIQLVNLGLINPEEGNLEIFSYLDTAQGQDAADELAGLEMGGGKITFDNPTVIHGNVEGSGAIAANRGLTFTGDEVDIFLIIFTGNITNDGTFFLFFNGPGNATFQNGYIQTANGRLVIPIRGTNAGDFGQITVPGSAPATLNGTLEAHITNGFATPIGLNFAILTSAQRTGTFSKLALPPGMTVTYNTGGATISVTGIVPVQILPPQLINGQFQLSFNTISNRSYTVQYNDNLASTNWMFLTNFNGTGSNWQQLLPASSAGRFFRVSEP